MNYAKAQKYAERLNIIALGQGQGPKALQLIEKATKTGDWVMLQNCHLGKSFMADLERLVYEFSLPQEGGKVIHEDFRLFNINADGILSHSSVTKWCETN